MSTLQYGNYAGTEANSESFHYSQAVKVGNVVKTSGQGGWDADGNISPDANVQVAAAFENVEKALKSIDGRLSWQDVYAVRTYHVDLEGTFDVVTANFKRVIPGHRPIWTCVEIGKLGIEGMKVEFEVEAVCPS